MKSVSRFITISAASLALIQACQRPGHSRIENTFVGKAYQKQVLGYNVRLAFTDATHYVFTCVDAKGREAQTAEGTYALRDGQIEFTDAQGKCACPGTIGLYRFKTEDNAIKFTVLRDECSGAAPRSANLCGRSWQRMPSMQALAGR